MLLQDSDDLVEVFGIGLDVLCDNVHEVGSLLLQAHVLITPERFVEDLFTDEVVRERRGIGDRVGDSILKGGKCLHLGIHVCMQVDSAVLATTSLTKLAVLFAFDGKRVT